MHVLLLILKIIGIALLVILGILLIFTLLLLFAPVRYRIAAVFPETKVKVKIRWLAGIVSLSIWYPADGRSYSFRIFGIPFNRVIGKIVEEDSDEDNSEPADSVKEPVSENEPGTDRYLEKELQSQAKEDASGGKEKAAKRRKNKGSQGGRIEKVRSKIKKVLYEVRNPDNIEAVKVIKNNLILLLKHLKPKKIYANMIIGTGDPCSTGLLFGVIGILMGLWPGDYTFVPDFDNRVIEGKVYCRGKIRVSVLLYYINKLLFDNTVKKLWKHTSKGNRRKAENGGKM